MRAVFVLGLWLSLSASAARRACATQAAGTPARTANVTVQLSIATTEQRVIGVLVVLEGEPTSVVRTDAEGRARFANRPLGQYVLRVRAVGFAPVEERIELAAAGEITWPVSMERSTGSQLLPTVIRTARRSPVPGLDERRATARGHIFDRASIDSIRPRVTTDLLRRVPSVRLVGSGVGFVPRTRRSSGFGDCPMSIYLDGVQVDDERGAPPAPPIGQPARGSRAAPPSVIDGISVDILEAVEVYVGASEIPSQFNQAGGSCGVIALWTRSRR